MICLSKPHLIGQSYFFELTFSKGLMANEMKLSWKWKSVPITIQECDPVFANTIAVKAKTHS